MVDSNGELKKQVAKILVEGDENMPYDNSSAWYIDDIYKVLDEAKKDFPMQELQFHDPRYTDECEQFTGHILAWYNKWFGDAEK